jgi:hypothetical protein
LLETSLGTFAGRVPSGGALVCVDRGLAAGGARLLIVFTPRYPTPGSNQQVQGAGIFPVSALTSPSLLRRVTVQKSGDDPPDFDSVGSESPPFGHLEPELLIDLVRTAVAPAGEDEHFRLRCAGGFLMAHGTAQQVAAVEATVRAIQDRLLRNVEVRCLATATESHDAGMFTGAPAGPTVTLHELAVPAMPGRAVAWFRGLETNVIRCFRVNIAQEAFSLYPEIAAARSGLLLSATCAPGVDDPTASLFLHFEHVAEPTVRDTKPQGNSMLTVRAVRDAGHSGPIADGKLVELGQGPPVSIDGHPFRTALQASVTFR